MVVRVDSKTLKNIEKLVIDFKKTGEDKFLKDLHYHFDAFINRQAMEISTLFNWIAPRAEVYEFLRELFDECLLEYDPKQGAYFVRYITRNIRGRGRGHFRQKLREATKLRSLDDISPFVLLDIEETSIESATMLIEMIRAAHMVEFSMQEVLALGCLISGVSMVELARELKVQKTRASHIKSKMISKLRAVIAE